MVLTIGCRSFTAHALNAEGVRRMKRGQVVEAANYFQRARATDPEDADACYNMAILAHGRAVGSQSEPDFRQAEEYYRQCLDRNPSHADCYRGLATLYADEGRAEDGFVLLESWANQDPGNPEPKIELARLYNEYGRLNRAEICLQQALAIDPNNVRALNSLGYVFEQKGMYADASAVYCRSLQIMPSQQSIARRQSCLVNNRLAPGPTAYGTPQNCSPCNTTPTWSVPANDYRAPLYCQGPTYPVGTTLNGCPVPNNTNNTCATPVSCAPQPVCAPQPASTSVCAVPAPCVPRSASCYPPPNCNNSGPGVPQAEPTKAISPEELAQAQRKEKQNSVQNIVQNTEQNTEQIAVQSAVPNPNSGLNVAVPGPESPADNRAEQATFVSESPTPARY